MGHFNEIQASSSVRVPDNDEGVEATRDYDVEELVVEHNRDGFCVSVAISEIESGMDSELILSRK